MILGFEKPPVFRVGLLLTERCNVSCEHCWFSCSGEGDDMSLELAKKVIDESTKLGAMWISFTGGEPFIIYDILLKLVSYSTKKCVLKEVVTNAFWGTSKNKTFEKLKILKDAGLDVINLSIDDFHQRYIPLKSVKTCYDIAKELKLKIVLMISIAQDSSITSKTIKDILKDPSIKIIDEPREDNPAAIAIDTAFIPVGRGEKISKSKLVFKHGVLNGPCRSVLTDIGVKPNGDVMPCCSALGLRRDAILGNVAEQSLCEILEKAWKDERYTRIRSFGLEYSDVYVNRCHQCHDTF